MAEQTRQPKNIFEQTLFGLQAVNDNIVAISQDLPIRQRKSTPFIGRYTRIALKQSSL